MEESVYSIDEIVYRYWQNRFSVLMKLFIGIDKIFCRYWWNRKPKSSNLACISLFPSKIQKSFTGIDEIVYQYWCNHIMVLMKSYTVIDDQENELAFPNTCIQYHQYRYMISLTLVYNFINTGIRFNQYWYTISSIPL